MSKYMSLNLKSSTILHWVGKVDEKGEEGGTRRIKPVSIFPKGSQRRRHVGKRVGGVEVPE